MSSHARPGNSDLIVSDLYLNVKISGAFIASGNQCAVKPHFPKVKLQNMEDAETFNVVYLKSELKRALKHRTQSIIIQESSLLLSLVEVLTVMLKVQ